MANMYVEVGRHLTIPCELPEVGGRYAAYWYKEIDGNQQPIFYTHVRIHINSFIQFTYNACLCPL